jgi:hypothetical protein
MLPQPDVPHISCTGSRPRQPRRERYVGIARGSAENRARGQGAGTSACVRKERQNNESILYQVILDKAIDAPTPGGQGR